MLILPVRRMGCTLELCLETFNYVGDVFGVEGESAFFYSSSMFMLYF